MCAQWPSATASDYEWGDEWNVLALLFKGRRRPTTHSALRCDALRAQCIGCALRGTLYELYVERVGSDALYYLYARRLYARERGAETQQILVVRNDVAPWRPCARCMSGALGVIVIFRPIRLGEDEAELSISRCETRPRAVPWACWERH